MLSINLIYTFQLKIKIQNEKKNTLYALSCRKSNPLNIRPVRFVANDRSGHRLHIELFTMIALNRQNYI